MQDNLTSAATSPVERGSRKERQCGQRESGASKSLSGFRCLERRLRRSPPQAQHPCSQPTRGLSSADNAHEWRGRRGGTWSACDVPHGDEDDHDDHGGGNTGSDKGDDPGERAVAAPLATIMARFAAVLRGKIYAHQVMEKRRVQYCRNTR